MCGLLDYRCIVTPGSLLIHLYGDEFDLLEPDPDPLICLKKSLVGFESKRDPQKEKGRSRQRQNISLRLSLFVFSLLLFLHPSLSISHALLP